VLSIFAFQIRFWLLSSKIALAQATSEFMTAFETTYITFFVLLGISTALFEYGPKR
jgi:hypothetical protein